LSFSFAFSQIEQDPINTANLFVIDLDNRIDPQLFESANNQQIPDLVGKLFHPDTIEWYLDGTPYVLGNAEAITDNENSGYIIRQQLRNDLMLDGITPIDVVYARRNRRFSSQEHNRLFPEILSRIPDEIARIQKIRVPQLINEPFDFEKIQEMLSDIGLILGDTISIIDNNRAGFIIRQYPTAGTEVVKDTRITLAFAVSENIVDETPEIIVVPDYRGQIIELAFQQIQNDNLSEGNVREIISEEPQGIIVAQFPEPGMEVDPFTAINFEISAGIPSDENRVVVPDLFGFSLEEVAEILEELELFPGEIGEEISLEKSGSVIQQEPPPGTRVNRRTSVDLLVALNENTQVEVPDVINLETEKALFTLKNSGLVPKVITQKKENGFQGIVFEQFPEAGQLVDLGTEVLITIPGKNRTGTVWPVIVGTAIVVAVSAASFQIRRLRKKKKIAGQKTLKIELKPKWEEGKQSIVITDSKSKLPVIKFKYFIDPGIQNIKTNQK
jgi:beta-lactam-binding protein with PASTA domain